MRKNIALILCLSLLAAGVLFSSFRVVILTERVRDLEQAQHIEPPPKPQEQLLSVKQRIAPPDNSLHKVLAIVDGDTIQIDTGTGPLKVRIIGIDTPETVHPFKPVQPFGLEASKRAKELLLDKTIKIQYDPDPKHGKWGNFKRLLVYIELPDGRDFGLVMISEGLARAYPKYPFSRVEAYLEVEQKAKNAKIGLWGISTQPVTGHIKTLYPPCGYYTDPKRPCKCGPRQIENYLARISGPLIDRIDIHVEVPPVPWKQLRGQEVGLSSEQMRSAVLRTREIQRGRFGGNGDATTTNATMSSRQVREHCKLDSAGEMLLKQAMCELGLSARAHDKVLRISRTIADMENQQDIQSHHLAEAIQYRRLDRQL
ncbi:MAG: thermonuclease family protein [Phycisphaerae bacterium]|nr:thermonuclease family protein [Phycisphaerae bacterium]